MPRLLETALVFLLTATVARAHANSGVLIVRLVMSCGPPAADAVATLELAPEREAPRLVDIRGGRAVTRIGPLAPGTYRLSVSRSGCASAKTSIVLAQGEDVYVRATLAPAVGETASSIEVEHRAPASYGSTFREDLWRDLPLSRDAWSLLETVEPAAIVDRIDSGGLHVGEPGRVGIHGMSWTQTSFRLGDLDITDPEHTGTPLLHPFLAPLANLSVATAQLPLSAKGPGPTVQLSLRRPQRAWSGNAEVAVAPRGLQGRGSRSFPAIARFGSSSLGRATVGGPLGARAGVVVSAGLTNARRFERDDATELRADVKSLVTHWVLSTSRGEVRALGAYQGLERPHPARVLFLNRDASLSDRALHLQATWERRASPTLAWSVTGGFQSAVARPGPDLRWGGVIERLRDGPVQELALPSRDRRHRWDLTGSLTASVGERHTLKTGASWTLGRISTTPLGPSVIAERVAGLPARVWDFSSPGIESRRRLTDFAGFVEDRMAVGRSLTLDGGLRFESTMGSARSATSVRWRTVSPRLGARWSVTRRGTLAVFGGYGRHRHRLSLRDLAFGDPTAPRSDVFRWEDANEDRSFQERERGVLVARLGPGSEEGSNRVTVDPDLRPPRTDEAIFGVEARKGDFVTRLAAIRRRSRDLIESVNVGVPAAGYGVRLIPDPAGNLIDPGDDQLLPAYDRTPSTFGRDRYLLSNPPGLNTLFEGVELTIEKTTGRLLLSFGATASRATGPGAHRGFRVQENDAGLIGERLDQPNADTLGRGRLFFDRAYTVKIAAAYQAPCDVRLGAVVRYQDGQPFARLVVVPDLGQGPEAIQAIRNGRSRFSYTLTVDARLEKGLARRNRRLGIFIDAFNLLDARNEVEEDVVTGGFFRTPTALQPPRALRVGLTASF